MFEADAIVYLLSYLSLILKRQMKMVERYYNNIHGTPCGKPYTASIYKTNSKADLFGRMNDKLFIEQ